jgi:hypothetical protein
MNWKCVVVAAAVVLPPVLLRLSGQPLTGKALGIPYDFRPPTPGRLKQTLWNRSTDSLLVPHVYGWGYSLNFRAVGQRLGLVGA